MANCESLQLYREYTEYEALPSKLSKADPPLSIDLDSDASAFAYTKEIILNFPLSLVVNTGSKVLVGRFVIVIKVGQTVLFRQEVELKFQLFAFPVAPGLVIFTWNPVGFGTIKTLYSASHNLPSDGSGGAAALDTDALRSEQGFFCFDLSDSDGAFPTDADVSIRGIWFSPPYLEALPQNATVEIEDEHWPGAIPSPATFRFAFKKVLSGLSTFLDDTSTLRLAQLASGATNILHRVVRPQTSLDVTYRRAMLPGLSQGHIAKTADNAMWLLAIENEDKQARLWMSEDDFTTHKQVVWRNEAGAETKMEIFEPGTRLLDFKSMPSGGHAALGQKGDVLSFARIKEGEAPVIRTVGTGNGGQYSLSVESGRTGDGLIVVASIDHQFESEDEFATAPREKVAETA